MSSQEPVQCDVDGPVASNPEVPAAPIAGRDVLFVGAAGVALVAILAPGGPHPSRAYAGPSGLVMAGLVVRV